MARSGTKKKGISAALIAPCGMNCRLCRAHIRDRNPCPGCRADDSAKPKTRVICRIKICERISREKARYCFDCDRFPCDALTHLDKRYRTKYGMSMIDNLTHTKALGIRRFIQAEKEKWACPACTGLLCVHDPQCPTCGRKWR